MATQWVDPGARDSRRRYGAMAAGIPRAVVRDV